MEAHRALSASARHKSIPLTRLAHRAHGGVGGRVDAPGSGPTWDFGGDSAATQVSLYLRNRLISPTGRGENFCRKKHHILAHFPLIYPLEHQDLLHSERFHAIPSEAQQGGARRMQILLFFPLRLQS